MGCRFIEGERSLKHTFLVILMIFQSTVAYSQASDGLADRSSETSFALVGRDLSFGFVNMSQSDEFTADGPSFGLGIAAKIGSVQNLPLYLEWNSTLLRGTDRSSNTMHQGLNPFVIAAGSAPVGTIDLMTSVDASGASADATTQITDSTSDTVTIITSAFSPSAPETAVSQFALSQTVSGGAFAALSTNGEAGLAAAYGTIFDDTGFVFLGAGDEGGAAIRSSVTESVQYTNHSLLLSTGFPIDDHWTFTPKIGPMYRSFDRTSKSYTVVDINEGFELAPAVPDITLAERISLDSTYFGVTLGATLTGKIQDDWLFSIGADAGIARFEAKADSFENVTIANTNTRIPGRRLTSDGTSGTGRISAGLTHVRPGGAVISLGAFVDFMSDVPYVATETIAEPAVVVDGATVSIVGTGATYRTRAIREKELISSGIAFSFVMFF